MLGHAITTISQRAAALEAARAEILGDLPKGPFEFSSDLTFDDQKPGKDDPPLVQRLKQAVRRDCRFGSANGFYIRLHGKSQTLRGIYDGGRQLIDGGAK